LVETSPGDGFIPNGRDGSALKGDDENICHIREDDEDNRCHSCINKPTLRKYSKVEQEDREFGEALDHNVKYLYDVECLESGCQSELNEGRYQKLTLRINGSL
jgi:hypothetical protein